MDLSSAPQVALLGAYDRFNYGDLLFPIVARRALAGRVPPARLPVYALADSDLSHYGALPTQGLKKLLQPGALRAGDTVMFVGGGTVGVGWTNMYANLLGRAGNQALYYLGRLLGAEAAERFSRWRLGGRAPFPWVASSADFAPGAQVAYNAVGGSELEHLPPDQRRRALECLAAARYLSVRDARSQALMAPIRDRVDVHLSPDSAVLMSHQFPLHVLEERSSPAHRRLLAAGDYLCFHCNHGYARQFGSEIVQMLEAVHARHGLRIVLLPIGRYVGLDDVRGLQEIQARLSVPAETVSEEASLWEIMLTVARSAAFVGTSLHGHVTAQSFAVPHLGLSDRPCKLDHYLDTWEIDGQRACVPLAEVADRLGQLFSQPAAWRKANRARLIERAQANFDRMATACGFA